MAEFLNDAWFFIIGHWEMIFILTLPYIKDILVAVKDFTKAMKTLSQETHKILKNHEMRLTALEEKKS